MKDIMENQSVSITRPAHLFLGETIYEIDDIIRIEPVKFAERSGYNVYLHSLVNTLCPFRTEQLNEEEFKYVRNVMCNYVYITTNAEKQKANNT